jgi:heat shock protein HslJ
MMIFMEKKKNPMVPGRFRVAAGFITVFMMAACAGSSPVQDESPGFSGVLGKNWQLIEIRTEAGGISLDRAAMEADGIGEAFTLMFEAERVGGMALPNRYFGPYTRKGPDIKFDRIASTLMASFKELDVLKEREYFDYLDRVQSWARDRGSLELHSATPDGQRAVLVFE